MKSVIPLKVRLEFLDLGKEDLAALAAIRPLLVEVADEFVESFYQHLLSFEETRAFLLDAAVRDRLLEAQRTYLIELADESIDEQTVERRLSIGRTHARVGLSTTWYLGAYEIYSRQVATHLDAHLANDAVALAATKRALIKRLLFDIQLGIEGYTAEREEQLEFVNRELASSHHGLALEVDEKSAALRRTEARVRAAEQLAEVGTLAAGLAHEIGTPMTVIRGHAESLETAVSDDRSRWRVRTIVDQIDRISNIMQGLLNLARPRAPVREAVILTEVLDTAVSFLGEKLRRRGIEIIRSTGMTPSIMGDSQKLQQLFLNLILNAADAMPNGGTLRLTVARDSDGCTRVRVADTGVGIEEADLSRIFEPFFTSKPASQGSGLGLVVARGIAIDHGGDMEVKSKPGEGTVFTVILPA